MSPDLYLKELEKKEMKNSREFHIIVLACMNFTHFPLLAQY
jgi:glutamate racemase